MTCWIGGLKGESESYRIVNVYCLCLSIKAHPAEIVYKSVRNYRQQVSGVPHPLHVKHWKVITRGEGRREEENTANADSPENGWQKRGVIVRLTVDLCRRKGTAVVFSGPKGMQGLLSIARLLADSKEAFCSPEWIEHGRPIPESDGRHLRARNLKE